MAEKGLRDPETTNKLLILQLLHSGVRPEIIANAVGVAPITIRKMFPMKEIKKRGD